MVQAKFKFDSIFFKRFLKLFTLMFPSVCSAAALLTIFLLLLSLTAMHSEGHQGIDHAEQVVIFHIGYIPSHYIEVLGKKDRQGFTTLTLKSVGLILAEAFISSCIKYVGSLLYITWRQLLCKNLHQSYFTNILYYYVNVVDSTIDNPDQRITQDVDKLTNTFSTICVPLIISPFTIAYYMYQVSKITGYLGPVSVLIFFVIFTIINKLLMAPVIHYVFQQERREGDFRFKHMQMRVYAESAAFYQASQVEELKTNQKLDKLISTQRRLMHWKFALNFATKIADYTGSILSYIALAFPIFMGHYDNLSPTDLASLISSNGFVSISLIYCFTRLIDLANSVSDMAGAAHRIGQLMEVMGRLKSENEEHIACLSDIWPRQPSWRHDDGTIQEEDVSETAFELNGVTYGPPQSKAILCKELTMRLQLGSNVLITGDSGCGKTSLLRVIAGLWRPSSGFVNRLKKVGPSSLLYLPQKPYLTTGSLRDQILFPVTEADVVPDDEKMLQYLSVVGLGHLVERLGGLDTNLDRNWYDELSPGETQRLSFVRLFFHTPRFAVLDESTSQVSQEMETTLYQTCQFLNITFMSIGHRDSIRRFHNMVLHFGGNGGSSFGPIGPGPSHYGDGKDRDHFGGKDLDRKETENVADDGQQEDSHAVPVAGVQVSDSES